MAKKQKVARSALSFSRRLDTHVGEGIRNKIARAKKKEKRAIRKIFARCLFPDVTHE